MKRKIAFGTTTNPRKEVQRSSKQTKVSKQVYAENLSDHERRTGSTDVYVRERGEQVSGRYGLDLLL